jgi:hypothetical protein
VSTPDPDPDGDPRPPSRDLLTLVHHHPGRLRVRADTFRVGGPSETSTLARPGEAVAAGPAQPSSPGPFDRVRAALDAEPGIVAVTHNARTGSILIEYQPGLTDSETILGIVAGAVGLDMPSDEGVPGKKPALIAIDAAREVNELVSDLTGHQADLRGLVPMGMAAFAAYSFVYGKDARLPRWDNLLYWSYNIFSQLHRREIERRGGHPRTDP